MRKLILIPLILTFIFAQHEARVNIEKGKDAGSDAHKKEWVRITGESNGIIQTVEQLAEFKAKEIEALRFGIACYEAAIIAIEGGSSIPVDEIQVANLINELVNKAEAYFWSRPRADTIERIQSGDAEQIQYLVDSYLTRIYKAYHIEVITKLEQLIKLIGG